jgi:hypothetical protein
MHKHHLPELIESPGLAPLEVRECYGCGGPTISTRRPNAMCPRCLEEVNFLNNWYARRDHQQGERERAAAREELIADLELRGVFSKAERRIDALGWVLVALVLGGITVIGWDYGKALVEWVLMGGVQ